MLLIPDTHSASNTLAARTAPVDSRRAEDRQFLAMQRGFAQSGGLAKGDEVARMMRRDSKQPLSTLARHIVDRQAVSFVWCGQIWLPLFQFDLPDMRLRDDASAIVSVLTDLWDDWELALWFVQPNDHLGGVTPIQRFEADPFAVLQSARTDRFIALG
jgi:hypothetical protein